MPSMSGDPRSSDSEPRALSASSPREPHGPDAPGEPPESTEPEGSGAEAVEEVEAAEGPEAGDAGRGGGGSRSAVVAVGIFASRILGLLRETAVAHYFGTSAHSDVFRFALRAPNVLQNLLGEGTLSASFIPIYARMVDEGRSDDAGRFAGAIFGLLTVVAAAVALFGVLFAEAIVTVFATGFLTDDGGAAASAGVDRFPLAVVATKITFPMTALLVLHAWALGVLNSHRRFFLPYFAPVLWNAAMIGSLVVAGQVLVAGSPGGPVATVSNATLDRLLYALCWGALAGGLLQFLVQVPLVWKLLHNFRPSLSLGVPGVKQALGAFGPVVAGRGVAQLGSYLDLYLATWLATGALAALGFAQTLYVLPISLFAMSVAAAELPELSRGERPRLGRVERGLGQIAFLTVPTVVGYLAFGFLLAGAIFRTGSFGLESHWLVYGVLAAYTCGLPATNTSRLLQNVFFALGDTKTPARVAVERVVLAAAVALPAMFLLDRLTVGAVVGSVPGGGGLVVDSDGDPKRWGAAGLALGSAVGAWYELRRLRTHLRRELPGFALPVARTLRMGGVALGAAAVAGALWWLLPFEAGEGGWELRGTALAVVGSYAVLYLVAAHLLAFPEIESWIGRFTRRFRRGG